jgi:uncharacterized protein (DUF1499 family)
MNEIERTSPNSARTTATHEHEPGTVLDATERAISSLPRWTLEERDETSLHTVRATSLLRFKDDINATVEPDDTPGWTRLKLTSASRIGKGDLGQNPRNLRELLDALDRELSTRS